MSEIEIPKGWKLKKISDITKCYSGGTPSTNVSEYWENGTIPWLRSGELKDKIISQSRKYITKKGLDESSARFWPKNSVLIAITGANVGKTAMLDFETSGNQSIIGILPSEEVIPNFLWYYLQFSYNYFWSKATGGAQPHINGKIVSEREITFPEIEIQEKIVMKLDHIVNSLLEKKMKIYQFQKLKIKVLETSNQIIPYNNNVPFIFKKLYVGILRREFKKLTSCPEHSLSSLCEIKGGGTPSKFNPDFWNGSIPWISPKDMKSYEIHDSRDHITQNAVKRSSTNLISENSVLVVFRSGILSRTLPVSINRIPVTLNQDIKSLMPKPAIISDFLALYLISQEEEILKNCVKQVTTVHSLITEKFSEIQIPVPDLKTQKQICQDLYRKAKLLSSISFTLKSNSEKISNTRAISKIEQSVLSSAFSGSLLH